MEAQPDLTMSEIILFLVIVMFASSVNMASQVSSTESHPGGERGRPCSTTSVVVARGQKDALLSVLIWE